MITFSKIGKKGNLGNQLFQIASTIGLATRNNHEFSFLEWKHQNAFKNGLPLLSLDQSLFNQIEEKEYHYHQWTFGTNHYDIIGWLQTEKYFDIELTKHYFEFSDSLKEKIKKRYSEAFKKRTILISIRRGDFVNHKDYFQLPINYYLNSLAIFFPEWDSCNLIVLSDDINYCKYHFSFLENAFFGNDLNETEQLCLGAMCDDFIISNSTFSWWTAWLGEKSDSKIIRPFKNFDGEKSKELNDKDYYPERWTKYNHLDEKLKFSDLAFSINMDRNNDEIKTYLSNYFEAEFVSNENNLEPSKNIYFINKDYFLPPLLVYFSFLKLKKTKIDLVINNAVEVFGVSKVLNYKEFVEQKDFGFFSKIFSFSKREKKKKNFKQEIYLKKSVALNSNKSAENEFLLCFSAGRFLTIGGYKFSFKRFLKTKERQLKRSVKKKLNKIKK
ncbi:MAG: alpha-1,2-fucosyltransferase [Flavobacterium sp.]|uniref:alpha-1,2-fucosyltransferase n=1 Tax=Flavobacterium sp. TaxID=239 RepID=UPI001B25CC41|nr:alpha-1,2-fucosyltransferase [Flavobacterium sp.]MBO9585985.1 alpha-1,2-fucosyltransferase [Flavobacterium sp.]